MNPPTHSESGEGDDTRYEEETSLDDLPPAPVQPWQPRLRSFTTVVKFHISDDDPPLKPYRAKINATTLKEAWRGTRHESMQHMKFENALVKRITIANKSTDSNFNAALKFFDKDDQALYHPVPTFDCDENEEEEAELCGIPLWGDQTGAREVFHNPDPPTHAQMAYANFCIEDLERGVTHHKYDIPIRSKESQPFRTMSTKNVREQMQKMEITHIPKEPCAKYFEWALTQQNQLYPPNFTDSPAHAVGGLPEYFCIHTADYHKVEPFAHMDDVFLTSAISNHLFSKTNIRLRTRSAKKKRSVGTQNIDVIKVNPD